VFEKLLLKKLELRFRPNKSTIHKLQRVVYTISASLEKKHYYAVVFLDVEQAIWYDGVLFNLKKMFSCSLLPIIDEST